MLTLGRLASTVLVGIAANTDNLTIGIGYGIRRRRIGWKENVLIAVITTSITLIALAAGLRIRALLPPTWPDPLGGALLLAFAAWNFYRESAGAEEPQSTQIARFASQSPVGLRETLFLSTTLSINNIGLAIAGGIGGIGFAPAAATIFGFSVALLWLGQAIGARVTRSELLPRVLRHPAGGNAVLALAGVMMIAGY